MFQIVMRMPGQIEPENAGLQQTNWAAPASGTFPTPPLPQAPAPKPPLMPEELRDELLEDNSKFLPSDIKRYCEVLGVPSSLKDPIALKSAYRQVALKWNPDENAGNKHAAVKFLEAAQAYNSLRLHLGV